MHVFPNPVTYGVAVKWSALVPAYDHIAGNIDGDEFAFHKSLI